MTSIHQRHRIGCYNNMRRTNTAHPQPHSDPLPELPDVSWYATAGKVVDSKMTNEVHLPAHSRRGGQNHYISI